MDQTMNEMKFLKFSGILSHSFRTIFTWKKLFAQITLTLILPLTLTFIAHMEISNRFFTKIESYPYELFSGAFDNYRSFYITEATTGEWRNYFLFKLISIATVTVLSLLSTASAVYTIACIYTGRDVTYRKSMKVVPKVWKRLTVTLLCMFLIIFAYSLIASVVIFICNSVLRIDNSSLFWLICDFLYIYGFLYLMIVWQLASVVSVLESSYGIKSMIKATDLMNGKRIPAIAIWFMFYYFLAFVLFVYMSFVMYSDAELTPVRRVMIGIICAILLVFFFLIVIVAETVLYLVCKSHHRETIDPVSLSTFLGAYLSDSPPVFGNGEDIQLGRPQNEPLSQV